MTVGSSGHGVSTTARTSSPAARAASIVSSEWLIVPRPGPRGDDERQAERDGEVAHVVAVAERDEQPSDALDDEHVRARGGGAPRPATSASASIVVPASSAARWGETAGPKVRVRDVGGPRARDGGEQLVVGGPRASGRRAAGPPRSTRRGARGRRAQAPAGRPSPPVLLLDPRHDRLERGHLTPAARIAAHSAAARIVLPAPVSVPVTKQPRMRHGSRAARPRAAARRAASRLGLRRLGVEQRVRRGVAVERLVRRGDRHRRRRAEARLQRRAPEHLRGVAQLVLGVRRHHRQAQARGAVGHRRRPDRLREHAALERGLADAHRRRARRRRSAARSASSSPTRRSPRARARRAGSRRWRAGGRRAAAAPRAPRARRARPRRPAAAARSRRSACARCSSAAARARRRRRRTRRRSRAPCRACRRRRRPRARGPPRRPRRGRRGPTQPVACASSTTTRASRRCASSQISSSGATSPSIEKTDSVTTSAARGPACASPHARCSMSLWL